MARLEAVGYLREIYDLLAEQQDLTPNNPIVTASLQNLVDTLRRWQSLGWDDFPEEPALADVRAGLPALCGLAECEMEKWWARKILSDPCPAVRALAPFWYLADYRSLCRAEIGLIDREGYLDIALLGCGAMPLSAIYFAEANPETIVRCVDCDGEACQYAYELIAALGLSARIEVIECLAEQFPVSPGETVVCTSLLRAPGLYQHLRNRQVTRILLRDAEGPYRWLYAPARTPGPGFREWGRTPPSSAHINTSRYFVAT